MEATEQGKKEREGSHGDTQVVGAHYGNAYIPHHSHASTEEKRAEEGKHPINFQAYLPSPWPLKDQFPIRNMPLADFNLSVTSPSTPLPLFSAAKNEASVFSFSSFCNPGGGRRFQKPRHLKVIDATLRCAAAVFALVAFCVMTSTRETRVAAGSTFDVKFSDFQAYKYLVALNVLAFVYSSAQVVVIAQSGSSSSIFASPIRSEICKFLCDEILAFCLFSASSSAATASELALHGLHNIWPPACSTWKLWKFCLKADAAITLSFFASFSVILSSLFSGFYLLHLVTLV